MKKKFQIAFNRFLIFSILMGIIMFIMAEGSFAENDIGVGIGFIAFGVLFIGVPVVLCPWIYIFDEEGISFMYLFLPKERYLWKNVRDIYVAYFNSSSKNGEIFELLFGSYVLNACVEGKKRFYMYGSVSKTFRTKRLLKKYWDGHIESVFSSFTEGSKKRKKKKYKPKKIYDANQVIAMEKSLYAKSKDCIKPYIDQATQLGLELRTSYLYTTKNGEQFQKRPDKDYSYMFFVEIFYPYETDKHRIIEVSVDLVFVRLGRTAYRGVENKAAFIELSTYMRDVLEEIRNNGLEAVIDE